MALPTIEDAALAGLADDFYRAFQHAIANNVRDHGTKADLTKGWHNSAAKRCVGAVKQVLHNHDAEIVRRLVEPGGAVKPLTPPASGQPPRDNGDVARFDETPSADGRSGPRIYLICPTHGRVSWCRAGRPPHRTTCNYADCSLPLHPEKGTA